MGMYEDIMLLEGADDRMVDEIEMAAAMQRTINQGDGWRMHGSMGRAMMGAIEAGQNLLGKQGARDYWGNRIPSRDEVEDGTKGSRSYVVAAMGEEWAAHMEAL